MKPLPLLGTSILVIEGKATTAADLRHALIRLGAIVHVVSTIHAGLMIASRKRLHGAVLDCISHGAGLSLCAELAVRRVPFMFYGGILGQDGDETASCMADLIAIDARKAPDERKTIKAFGSGEDWHQVA